MAEQRKRESSSTRVTLSLDSETLELLHKLAGRLVLDHEQIERAVKKMLIKEVDRRALTKRFMNAFGVLAPKRGSRVQEQSARYRTGKATAGNRPPKSSRRG